MSTAGPMLGNDAIAAVFGGIVGLALAGAALVLRRDHLREGRELPTWAWLAGGAGYGVLLYLLGLLVYGRGPELLEPGAEWGACWTLWLLAAVGAIVAYMTGARAGWHWAGVGVLASLALASAGWAAHLVISRIGALLFAPSFVTASLAALLGAQLIALLLVVAVAAYMLDGLVRRSWTRHASRAFHDPAYQPKVAVQVACYNEPPEIVVRTLDSLVAQDYPREKLHLMLADDTTDPAAVEILRQACAARGIAFLHRTERIGFKAGALNAALRHTPADAELIAIVDADFVCEPNFIRDVVGYFADEKVAFAQTKLDYSNNDESFTSRYASMMEQYFYSSMMHTRNEANAILFAGTMGMLRKRAIEEVGGWTDGHVGEDVDLSCRLLMAGWTSLYVPRSYGKGLQTPHHEAFRNQQTRWAYGGARILRDHGKAIVDSKHMSATQKGHYLYGPLFWLDGSLGFVFACSMLLFAAAVVTGNADRLPLQDLVFVGLIPVLIILEGMLRAAFTMRRVLGISMKEVGAMVLMGWSGKFANATSAWAALLGVPRPFYRTPKHDGPTMSAKQAAKQAVRVAPIETALALLQVAMGTAMAVHLAVVGPGSAPLVLLVAAILMTAMWACYFGAAPLCIYLGHTRKGAPAPTATVADRAPLARALARPFLWRRTVRT